MNEETINTILKEYPELQIIEVVINADVREGSEDENSYKRKKLNNRSPYETFSFYHGQDVLQKLGCIPVSAGNIMLKPKLIKK